MKIDTAHLHYWMEAIRHSQDHNRTLDAFWQGQLQSKEWLIDNLKHHVTTFISIDIHGGWVGVLSSMLFQSGLPIKEICSVDIDPDCEPIANIMNTIEENVGRFRAVTADMCQIKSKADVIINTVCEHLTQSQYNTWLDNLPKDSIIVVQGNNYDIPEHVRTSANLQQFVEQSKLNILFSGEQTNSLYTRYMVIGKK